MVEISTALILNSILLGIGLAMDAFSVSLANGLNDPDMKGGRLILIAGTFGAFQFAMPMIGWFCVHAAVQKFQAFQKYIPWIALILLIYIGGEMLIEGIREMRGKSTGEETVANNSLGFGALMLQGIATSIDALSVGFTISEYNSSTAWCSSMIIGIVTWIICIAGIALGRKFGTRLAGKASLLGGIILIGIGLEIWIRGVFF